MKERLQKVIASACGISRRCAEELIKAGEITINGEIAQLGCKIDFDTDTLVIGNRRINLQKLQAQSHSEFWMFNKPKGVVCSHDDPFCMKTLQEYIPKPLRKQKWMFVGRLDKDSEGLLLLTTDGELANKIAHPSSEIEKTYRVHVDYPISSSIIPKLQQGLSVEGEHLSFAEVSIVNSRKLNVVLKQGKKREIRRLLAAFGYDVLKLKRWKIGQLILDKRLAPGQSRKLSPREIDLIFKKK